jgi:ribosomal protein S18 acetylase RimI-like enzyme
MSKPNPLKGIVQDVGKVHIEDTEYKYMYCNTFGLLLFCTMNKLIESSLKKIMISHRHERFNIYNFVTEEFLCMNEAIPLTVNYLLIHAGDKIVGISRVMYNEEHSIGEISAVHTSKKHRGKKICQGNIGKLVELTREKYKIKYFKLAVDTTNKAAIKCYENIGFEIYGDVKHFKNEDEYTMELKFDDDEEEKSNESVGGGHDNAYNKLYNTNKKMYIELL